ncbi:ABC transporter ATP-binding protein [Paenibacillus macerans]|uniref:ABC transporter family protein n=2 Tax=Paenibacillus macerans TaxID=44252 RepID=A0A090Z873_PAEMA|nr:ABC transporter ATP-binding protein [Paenibacillus macerans]KFN06558.1 ABC transporter family protein [Paenibacillus macerans]MCY7558183.1 ABC transporter ATP-binding protein [Paenibacillus macerans]MEC0138869.1 ABC transporter ATP-binding protein [Paenibacillus macerans]MEC0151133.1 ABC transporter ATP-binding protein [Paenibacillus macerans]MUG24977.1 ATP-binding cassette domain-containing protein [Paenibacillus macerans]
MNSRALIATHNLSKMYNGVYRVNKVNLAVPEGEIFGFLGPNGAGKSTSLKMLLGLIKPTEGEVRVFGRELAKDRRSILKQIGSLIESPSYYGHLTGWENLKIMQRLHDAPAKNLYEVLRIVRLEKQKDKRVDHYSLGMKQRLGIAMALLAFPRLLILDEPTNGLDPAGILEIRELIKSLPARYGMTIMLSSHLLSEIEQIASSVGIISNGQLLFQGTMGQLQAKTKVSISLKTSDNQAAERLLLKHGFQASSRGPRLLFDHLDDTLTAQVNRLLVDSGLDVFRIEERKKSLEDIFLELTGKERSL